jgi:hypothetical protein
LIGVKSSQTLVGIFLLLILVNPLCPIHLDVLNFLLAFDQSRPERRSHVLLLEDKEHMETSLIPFRLLRVNLLEKLEFKAILFLVAFAVELKMGGGKLDLLVEDVHEGEFDENPVFALSPFEVGVTR